MLQKGSSIPCNPSPSPRRTVATLSDRTGERGWVLVGALGGSAAGMATLAVATALGAPPGAAYATLFFTVFYSVASPLMIAWLHQAYRGSSDAAVGPALILTIGSLGGLLGPNIYGVAGTGRDAWIGHAAMAGVFCCA
jgi:hypothetical protein